MQIFDDLYEVGGVRSKLPDGSGPDRTPLPPPEPPCDRDRTFTPSESRQKNSSKRMAFSRRNFGEIQLLTPIKPKNFLSSSCHGRPDTNLRAGRPSIAWRLAHLCSRPMRVVLATKVCRHLLG